MLIEREIYTAQCGQNSGDRHRDVPHARYADANALGGVRMFTRGAHAKTEGSFVDDKRHYRGDDNAEPEQRVVETTGVDVASEPGYTRGIRRAGEEQFEKESRNADREQVDGDADDDLVSAVADGGHSVDHGEDQSADHARENTDPRAARIVGTEDGAERAGQHESLEGQTHDARSLRHHATAGGEEIGNGDAHHLRQEGNRIHAPLVRRALRRTRLTSGTDI